MDVAADIIQDLLAQYLKVNDLKTTASFPAEMKKLNEDIIEKIKESNSLKTHFAANISESIMNLKVNVVKAESSLMISDVENMRKSYAMV